MNNNEFNFDSVTGQYINQNINNGITTQYQNDSAHTITPTINDLQTNQQQMQNIPTVEQTPQVFINNTQVNSMDEKLEKKDGPNITFIIILFAIIFASIFFLFPYLLKILS